MCIGLCRCGNCHREDEYVELDSLPDGWNILDRLSDALLGSEGCDCPEADPAG